MTEQLTVAETFIVELATAGVGLRLTQTIAYNLHRATTEQGWTIPQLVTEATRDLDTAANPAAVITDRIRIAATVAPPRAVRSKTGLPKAHDGCCEDGWIYDESVDPPVQSKCPGVTG
jgi:hypothetical protein